MTRLVLFLLGVVAVAAGLSWLADQPGTIMVSWPGYDMETSIFRAAVIAALLIGALIFLWSIARQVWQSPAAVGRFFHRRKQERGLDALSSGMIAIGAGDRALATRYAVQARKTLPNEPLTHLLRAQAAQLSGDRTTSRRIFEAMLSSPDTEQLGLRGLFLEAEREGEAEAARQFAARAMALNPKLAWSVDALFDIQCKNEDWAGALETLSVSRKNGHIEKPDADRRRAVLLTAQAQAIEDDNGQKALALAQEAHGLAPDLVPAAVIAGRQLASRGSTPKAARVIEKAWKLSPHPDLATAYAFARLGDSPRDRLERIQRLAKSTPHSSEGPIAVATAAIEARNWQEARAALAPLLDSRLSQRVCTLMARIENGERRNQGGVREWLARAVHAPRDPAWTADGIVSETWKAVSPVTGALDAFQWRVPVEAAQAESAEQALEKMEELVMLGNDAADGPVIEAGEIGTRTVDRKADADRATNSAIEVAVEPEPRTAAAERPRTTSAIPVESPSPATTATAPPTAAPSRAASSAVAPAVVASATVNMTNGRSLSPAAASEASISVEIATQPIVVPPPPQIAVPVVVEKPKIVVAKPVAPAAIQSRPAAPAHAERTENGTAGTKAAALVTGVSAAAIEATSRHDTVAALRPVAAKSQDGKSRAEPQLFVPPRAPDDPGPGADEIEVLPGRDYRSKPAQR